MFIRYILLLGLFVGSVVAARSTYAQDTSSAIVAPDLGILNHRIDSLAVELQKAMQTMDQQQAMIDIMLQTQTALPADAPLAPTGVTIPGQIAAPQQASNLLNPNISLIGDIRGNFGRDFEPDARAFQLHEAEIGIQAPIDPYARADAFIAISPEEGIDLEETYITFQTLPAGIQAKVGKFRSNFGKFNRVHLPETQFGDRPLVTQTYFGEEGLAGVGISLSVMVPNRWVYLNLDVEATSLPEEAPAFGLEPPPAPGGAASEEELITGGRRRDLMYLSRLGTFLDLGESANITLGGTYATGVYNEVGTLRTHMQGIDVTLRWQPPRRAIYQSVLWQTEVVFGQRESVGGGFTNTLGLFSFVDWQFSRRWHIGSRYDYTQFPDSSSSYEEGVLGFLAFAPSEFTSISWQARGVRRVDGSWHGVGMVKLTFNIGPHGAHPF